MFYIWCYYTRFQDKEAVRYPCQSRSGCEVFSDSINGPASSRDLFYQNDRGCRLHSTAEGIEELESGVEGCIARLLSVRSFGFLGGWKPRLPKRSRPFLTGLPYSLSPTTSTVQQHRSIKSPSSTSVIIVGQRKTTVFN